MAEALADKLSNALDKAPKKTTGNSGSSLNKVRGGGGIKVGAAADRGFSDDIEQQGKVKSSLEVAHPGRTDNLKQGLRSVSDKIKEESGTETAPPSSGGLVQRMKQAKGDPVKAAIGVLDENVGLGTKVGGLQVIVWAAICLLTFWVPPWVQVIPWLIVLNLNFVSPKAVFVITKWLLRIILDFAFGSGEAVKKVLDEGSAIDIKIPGWGKALILFVDVIVISALVLFGVIITTTVCQAAAPSGTIGGAVSFGASRIADLVSGGSTFSTVRDFCQQVNGIVSSAFSGVASPSGFTSGRTPSGSVADYAPELQRIAQEKGVEYCALEALMRKESAGNRYSYSTVYYSGTRNLGVGPSGTINPNSSPPYYGLSFSGQGHAIGLLQIMIYNDGRDWVNSSTPSRAGGGFGFSRHLTITDLIDPAINIQAGTHYYINFLKQGGDPVRAYDQYQAGPRGGSDPRTLSKFRDYYNECKART
jgi:hypothetical protein